MEENQQIKENKQTTPKESTQQNGEQSTANATKQTNNAQKQNTSQFEKVKSEQSDKAKSEKLEDKQTGNKDTKKAESSSSLTKDKKSKKSANGSSTVVLKLEQIARSMQRGQNEAALLQANANKGLFKGLIINAIGQLLYRLGLHTEYAILRIYRMLRRVWFLVLFGVVTLVRSIWRPLVSLLTGIGRDIAEPFVFMGHGFKRMTKAMKTAGKDGKTSGEVAKFYLRGGMAEIVQIAPRALSYFFPIAAIAILVVTVWSVVETPYSLAVTYNENLIGYVENDTVWDDAQRKVESRIRAVSKEQTFDADPIFQLIAIDVDERLNSSELADKIVEESTDQIQQATGVYVNGNLVAVCADDAAVNNLINTTISSVQQSSPEGARVEFVNNVEIESGIYFTESISNLAQMESTLHSENLLQTKVIVNESYEVELAYPELEEESDRYYTGTTRVSQRGVVGIALNNDEVTYINGIEVERVQISQEVITEAVPQITLIGTLQRSTSSSSYTGSTIQGSGSLMWPVPGYSYTTTEFGYHRGLDICAPYGTPIYAADSGTVIEAGWHWSFGYYVLISHGNGITTRYAHNAAPSIAVGTNVAKGELIGLVGSTGVSTGNHCHFEVTVNGGLVNPRLYISQP